ncbi:MAG: HflK protein [Treponema sp. GWB1_62_6]|nr:MAG: HflK protein [Treponema sp. GWA1_62_8]OHE66691.1 MAG: HflK protein [Treponema sp. GWB1_62_6]OHE67869.1 MAG: HflK protein [Treponema sp. GWC1_61_84]OHE74684.1 MAG: HflK protein [Treponema sp. RIFOXYC1_FULL_61_9]HCM27278.1 FtsH protease activity modulator HflK [Treponema sp.]
MRNVNPPNMPAWMRPTTVVIIVAAIAVMALFGTSFYIVDQTEEAVVTRFGRYLTTSGPGMHYKLPFGIDAHYPVKTRVVQTEQFGFRTLSAGVNTQYSDEVFPDESTMLTGDLNIVDVEWIIQYRIVDPKAWLFNVQERIKTIRDISQSAINMLVGDRTILDIMGPERTAIEEQGVALMNDTLKSYGLGIDIIAVKLQNIVPPKGVQEAFEDVNKAIQDMNRLINEGKEAYNKEIPKAQGEADRLVQVAQGYAAERVNKSNGDVARFNSVYEEYRKAPEVTRRRLYYEMMEQVFQEDKGTTLIDRDFQNFLQMKNLDSAGGLR